MSSTSEATDDTVNPIHEHLTKVLSLVPPGDGAAAEVKDAVQRIMTYAIAQHRQSQDIPLEHRMAILEGALLYLIECAATQFPQLRS
ncbi:MAG TPA: hypothetical protein VKY65_14635 [Alphaproteobacteria bacterium]|nr:hypothetical protein [Alphaproteobacteria bacterium]